MKPYNKYSCCIKCSALSDLISTRYMRLAFTHEEVIRRICARCGYVWDEAPHE